MGRRLRYSVAMSLDGFIATDDGGYDWIIMDPAIDFESFMSKFDTLVMGRGAFEVTQGQGGSGFPGMEVVVMSTTLDPAQHPDVTIIGLDAEASIAELKSQPGKDIWLFGGGVLFSSLLNAGLVDRVEVGVIPRLLGSGIPLTPPIAEITKLELHSSEVFPTGVVLLKYDVV